MELTTPNSPDHLLQAYPVSSRYFLPALSVKVFCDLDNDFEIIAAGIKGKF